MESDRMEIFATISQTNILKESKNWDENASYTHWDTTSSQKDRQKLKSVFIYSIGKTRKTRTLKLLMKMQNSTIHIGGNKVTFMCSLMHLL